MIELYEGRLGGGKTYSAAVRMVDHVRRGGIICTNVELIWDNVKSYVADRFGVLAEDSQFIPLADDQIGLFHRFTPSGTADLPVLVCIDEAHLTFNARDFAQTDKLYRETLTFLTQSRKVNTDIIFIAQSVLNMDKQFMRLVQFIWRFRDLARWKIPGLGINYPFKQILAVQFDYDGKTILQRSFVKKDSRIFGLYNTNSLIRPFPRLEVASSRLALKKVERKNNMVKYLLPIGILGGLFCAWLLYHNFTKNIAPPPVSTQAPSSAGSVNTTQAKPATVNPERDKQAQLYDIYAENFVAWNGVEKALKTDGGWYQVGEMSPRGYVIGVSERRAKVAQPDGRTGWVVASKDVRPSPTPSPAPSPTPAAREIIIAPDFRFAQDGAKVMVPAGVGAVPNATPITFPSYRNGVPLKASSPTP